MLYTHIGKQSRNLGVYFCLCTLYSGYSLPYRDKSRVDGDVHDPPTYTYVSGRDTKPREGGGGGNLLGEIPPLGT